MPKRVTVQLSLPGITPSSLARQLKKRGIKGDIGDNLACPLANYFATDPNVEEVEVAANAVVLTVRVPLPPVARKFVSEFDQGKHPALER